MSPIVALYRCTPALAREMLLDPTMWLFWWKRTLEFRWIAMRRV